MFTKIYFFIEKRNNNTFLSYVFAFIYVFRPIKSCFKAYLKNFEIHL